MKRTASRNLGKMAVAGGLLAASTGLAACSRSGQQPPQPQVEPAPGAQPTGLPSSAPGSATPAQPATGPAVVPPPSGPAPGGAARPSGPSANLSGEHHVVTVALAPPPAVPGASALTVEVRATAGFHMNELYPSGLRLAATNATAPAEVRRTDAEISQQRVAFRVPVQVTGAGSTVRGTARFAVCSAENCIPQTQDFAVNLP